MCADFAPLPVLAVGASCARRAPPRAAVGGLAPAAGALRLRGGADRDDMQHSLAALEQVCAHVLCLSLAARTRVQRSRETMTPTCCPGTRDRDRDASRSAVPRQIMHKTAELTNILSSLEKERSACVDPKACFPTLKTLNPCLVLALCILLAKP